MHFDRNYCFLKKYFFEKMLSSLFNQIVELILQSSGPQPFWHQGLV